MEVLDLSSVVSIGVNSLFQRDFTDFFIVLDYWVMLWYRLTLREWTDGIFYLVALCVVRVLYHSFI